MNIALNYGGREEIVNAVKNICKDVTGGKQNVDDIDDEVFSSYLYTENQPDVDLLIRTLYALAGKLCGNVVYR